MEGLEITHNSLFSQVRTSSLRLLYFISRVLVCFLLVLLNGFRLIDLLVISCGCFSINTNAYSINITLFDAAIEVDDERLVSCIYLLRALLSLFNTLICLFKVSTTLSCFYSSSILNPSFSTSPYFFSYFIISLWIYSIFSASLFLYSSYKFCLISYTYLFRIYLHSSSIYYVVRFILNFISAIFLLDSFSWPIILYSHYNLTLSSHSRVW